MFDLKPIHIGVLVKDLDASMEYYTQKLNVGPWQEFGELRENAEYYGKPHTLCYRVAMAPMGSLMVELIQPTEPGSVFYDDLQAHGEGIHHICVEVDDILKTEAECVAMGYTIQERVPMYEMEPGFSLGFCFIDSDKQGGIKLELVQEVHTQV